MTLFPGSNGSGYMILMLFLLLQVGFLCRQSETQYEIKKNQKEYSLVLEELERKNNLAVIGG